MEGTERRKKLLEFSVMKKLNEYDDNKKNWRWWWTLVWTVSLCWWWLVGLGQRGRWCV